MKTLKLVIAGIFLLVSSMVQSQVSVSVNIGTPPLWGPVGYTNVQYYFLPDVQAYYDIRATQFIYLSNGKWYRSRYLPGPYRNYDLYGGYKVVLNDYHGTKPYVYYNNHKVKYHKGYKGNPQKTIGKNPNYHSNNGNHNGNGNNHYDNGNKGNSNNDKGNNGKSNNGNKGNGNGKH
jgi:hypothetical protein